MTRVAPVLQPADDAATPIAPDALTWQAMSPAQKERFLADVQDTLERQHDLMTEGRPHFRAKSRAVDTLGRYFQRIGRSVYLASELPILYPGQPVVHPDLLAVLDVQDLGDADERTAWVVADEGKGPEFVLEVHYAGDEDKDFVQNVSQYARLGIQEYFIYNRKRQALVGYRFAWSLRGS
ncbi:MAG: Uma2 family endonuclease [Polyangiaceae bacterium]|nr:Uma2 family endonuclease [Polyangiaceae bacterium]